MTERSVAPYQKFQSNRMALQQSPDPAYAAHYLLLLILQPVVIKNKSLHDVGIKLVSHKNTIVIHGNW